MRALIRLLSTLSERTDPSTGIRIELRVSTKSIHAVVKTGEGRSVGGVVVERRWNAPYWYVAGAQAEGRSGYGVEAYLAVIKYVTDLGEFVVSAGYAGTPETNELDSVTADAVKSHQRLKSRGVTLTRGYFSIAGDVPTFRKGKDPENGTMMTGVLPPAYPMVVTYS